MGGWIMEERKAIKGKWRKERRRNGRKDRRPKNELMNG